MDKEQLKIEINHILDSGANDVRLLELFDRYLTSLRKGEQKTPEQILESFLIFNEKAILVVDRSISKHWLVRAMHDYANQFKNLQVDNEIYQEMVSKEREANQMVRNNLSYYIGLADRYFNEMEQLKDKIKELEPFKAMYDECSGCN